MRENLASRIAVLPGDLAVSILSPTYPTGDIAGSQNVSLAWTDFLRYLSPVCELPPR
jgi:hypothetical protein